MANWNIISWLVAIGVRRVRLTLRRMRLSHLLFRALKANIYISLFLMALPADCKQLDQMDHPIGVSVAKRIAIDAADLLA